MRHRTILAFGLFLFTLTTAPTAQPQAPGEGVERLLQERTPEERTRLSERLARLLELSPEERRQLLDRARTLHELERRLHDGAPRDLRRRMREEPREARGLWRRHFEAELKDRGRHRLEDLPPEVRRRLRDASDEERVHILRRFHHERMAGAVEEIRRLGRALRLDKTEVDRLTDLPPRARIAAGLKLRRRLIERAVETRGMPPGLTPEQWTQLRELDDVEFFRALREHGVGPPELMGPGRRPGGPPWLRGPGGGSGPPSRLGGRRPPRGAEAGGNRPP